MDHASKNRSVIRAGLYLRLSRDPHGTRAAVERQEIELREMCAEMGWEVAEVYVDNDRSAYNLKKPRKDYQRMMADIEGGALEAVAAWHNDRLHRSSKELNHFIEVVNHRRTLVAVRKGGIYDLTTPGGRLSAKIVGDVAEYESDHKSERLKSWWRQRHEKGAGHGSRRPFGYTDNRRSAVVEAEAELIKEAAKRLLDDGDTLGGIARNWGRRGLVGAGGASWSAITLRSVMVSAAISGRQEIGRLPDGTVLKIGRIVGEASWPAIISPERSDQLRSKLGDPSRRTNSGRPAGLLLTGKTGVAKCGLCGAPLLSRIRKRYRADGSRTEPVRDMLCYAGKNGGCGRLSIGNAGVEEIVSDAVLNAIDAGALKALLRSHVDQEALAELAGVESRRTELAAMWAAGELTRGEWTKARSTLDARENELTKRVEPGKRRVGLDGLPDGLRDAWNTTKPDGTPVLSLAKKRIIIGALVESVTIMPAGTTHRFEPERIAIKWRA
jgi:site-specific DNA recombinase